LPTALHYFKWHGSNREGDGTRRERHTDRIPGAIPADQNLRTPVREACQRRPRSAYLIQTPSARFELGQDRAFTTRPTESPTRLRRLEAPRFAATFDPQRWCATQASDQATEEADSATWTTNAQEMQRCLIPVACYIRSYAKIVALCCLRGHSEGPAL
jgi:antirestriction protein ArdC